MHIYAYTYIERIGLVVRMSILDTMKGVQCYEFFGGIALKNHAFSFFSFSYMTLSILASKLKPL